jgi:pimeloyl-ACP methyl ester carboxylesterase
MSPRSRLARKVLKSFLPIILVILLAVVSVSAWIVYSITRPPRAPYLVTPQTFANVTGPLLRASDVTWKNHDGTEARGWLMKGADGAPAVILLHGYGADRSWLLNLAVKLNESTNFTVLWPDLRGHGENPPVRWTLFGGIDGDDAVAAIEYLRALKTGGGQAQVSRIGIYGIELGSYAALEAAKRTPEVRALALDSVPGSPDDIISHATDTRSGMKTAIFHRLAGLGVRVYGLGKYQSTASCDLARSLREVRVMLLSGTESDPWSRSTIEVAPCFNPPAEVKRDLFLTGANLPAATGEQEESYDRPVIDFFDKALR